MSKSQIKKLELVITGQVQGVFFRQGVKAEAEGLGLTGWVRNEPGGSVRIVAEGEEENLQKLVEWAKLGTSWTKVENVEVELGEASGEFKSFVIR